MIVRISLKIHILHVHLSMLFLHHQQGFILHSGRITDRHRMRHKHQKSDLKQHKYRKQNDRHTFTAL